MDQGDAAPWLESRLTPREGETHLVFTTIAFQYFPPATQARITAAIETAGRRATDRARWPGSGWRTMPAPAAAARLYRCGSGPAISAVDLGRADFHGRWIDWRGA